MTRMLWIAGALQIAVAAANIPLVWILDLRKEHARLSPLVREMHVVQHAYIAAMLAAFGVLSILFAEELWNGDPLGTFLAALLALFWGGRLLVQRLFYDAATRRRYLAADIAFTLVFAYLAAVYTAAALGGLR